MNYADAGDVERHYGDDISPIMGRIDDLLTEASAMLRRRISQLDTWIADGTVDEVLARRVCRDMVLRVLQTPAGIRSEQTEDITFTYDRATMEPTAGELADLRPTGARSSIGMARTRPVL